MRETAARCDQERGRAKSEAAAHGMLAANASAIGNAIAQLTGLSESNVGTILHRTIGSLRAAWDEGGGR